MVHIADEGVKWRRVALSKNKTLEKAESVRRVKRVKFGERMGKLGEAEEKGGQERTREKGR